MESIDSRTIVQPLLKSRRDVCSRRRRGAVGEVLDLLPVVVLQLLPARDGVRRLRLIVHLLAGRQMLRSRGPPTSLAALQHASRDVRVDLREGIMLRILRAKEELLRV